MCKKFLLLVCFVLVAGLSGTAQAGTAIDVNNFSFELDPNGDQIYCHDGITNVLAWQAAGSAYCGVDPYCLGDAEYDPNSLTMVCTPEECFTDNHSGCHCWAATHGIVYCYLQATKPSAPTYLYQNMDGNDADAVIAAGRKYKLMWDAMSEIYAGSLETAYSVAAFYYGGEPTADGNVVATVSYALEVWVGDLNEWEHEWEPNLTLNWVATEGHPAVGKTLGLRWFSPSPGGPVRAYTTTENVRLEWVWATDAYDPVPADGAEDVARDANLAWAPGLYSDRHIVYFSTDFYKVDTLHEDANQGIQDPNTFDPTPSGGQLDLGKTYYWRIKEVNDGFVNPGGGVPDPPWDGDVWSFTVTGYAMNPSPSDGEKNVPFIGTILSWTPGTDSNSHDVYFGTDGAAVENATTSSAEFETNTEANSHNPGAMLFGRKYYWRIDEVNVPGGTFVKGNVWTFTIAGFYPVDDFDSYANQGELWAVWKDYWVNATGAEVFPESDANFTEDGNAMMYKYGNADSPYYSEAYADVCDLGLTKNWTHSGLEVLTLSFLGQPGNALDDMYVALRDGSNVTGKVLYPDANELGIGWTGYREWNIELTEFVAANSVDVTDVDRITIGFGDKSAGGTGTVWFDNIMLYPPRCRPEMAFEKGSFDWDQNCEVDSDDLALLTERDWLMSATGNITATPPSAASLTGWWKMDDNIKSGPGLTDVVDSSAYGYHGQIVDPGKAPGENTGAHHDPCCVEGTGSFTFDAFDDYVNLPAFNLDSNTVTISAWVKRLDQPLEMYAGFVFCFFDPNDPCDPNAPGTGAGLGLGSGGTYGFRDWAPWEINYELCYFWEADLSGLPISWTWDFHTGLVVPPEEWIMATLVVEPTKASVYMYDGELQVATNYATHYAALFNGPTHIGEQMQHPNRYFGGNIDDVRIYSYSLSPAEVLYMGLQGAGSQYLSLEAWRTDADGDNIINFEDFGIMADNWLEELLWP
ncbi:MAG: LamG domain-containing protein [Planctomycetota bacterium]|jgi:hypothetical protein